MLCLILSLLLELLPNILKYISHFFFTLDPAGEGIELNWTDDLW